MIQLTRFEDVAQAIEWACNDAISIAVIVFAMHRNDAISIAVIVFAMHGYDVAALEKELPEYRDDYFLSLTSRVHCASKMTPEMAIALLTDVNAHREAAQFQQVLAS